MFIDSGRNRQPRRRSEERKGFLMYAYQVEYRSSERRRWESRWPPVYTDFTPFGVENSSPSASLFANP